jgi:serine/threonine protein kinase
VSLTIEGFSDITPLDSGGFGSVFRATRTSTGGTVALKQLDRTHGLDEELVERRLRREIAAMVALKGHPNIVQVEEMISAADGPVIVMEFMDAGSVASMLGHTAPSAERIAHVAASIASGLAAAHEAGIVHRDIKPQNVLMNQFGQVKLCDFGIAAILKSSEIQTRTTSLSVRYASPEELDNDPDVGPPTDVYSLGAAIHHLLYGAPPSFKNRPEPDPDLTVVRRGNDTVRQSLCLIVEECLQREAALRPTAHQLADALSALSDTGPRRYRNQTPDEVDDRTIVRGSVPSAPPAPPPSPAVPPLVAPPSVAAPASGVAVPARVLPRPSGDDWWTR